MTTPTWITALADASLKADFTTFSTAGTLTEVEMTKALTDLVAEITKAKTPTLSSSQLADLKSIASNIGSMGASPYLQFIVNAFVNGNAANAVWTGGGATTTALGNLAAGASVTQLNELVGKWFLGTDLPISTVSLPTGTITITYSLSTAPLYGGSGGAIMSDVNQGSLSDCYLMSSLAEVANQDPSLISSMITSNGNGTYGVRFFVNGVAEYVTVNADLADNGTQFNSAPHMWASLIETAYAEAQASGVITGNTVNDGNSFSTIGNGGAAEMALEEITDASAITDFDANGSTWEQVVYNPSFTSDTVTAGLSTASVLSTLAAELLVGNDVLLGSNTNATDSNGKSTLIANHEMSVYGYDAKTGLLEIRNPWGVQTNQTWDTTFEISLATLLTDGDTMTADNAGAATTVAGASAVAAAGLQAMSQVKSYTVTDNVSNVDAGLASLIADTHMTALTVNGNTNGETLTLTGLATATTINMGGNSDAAIVTGFESTGTGLGTATSFSLGHNSYDTITLGTGSDVVNYTIGTSGGVESITNFSAARDLLAITLGTATLEQTLVGGGDWLSSTADQTRGVFLAGITASQKVTVSGGIATVA